jgi:hypothetical protein
MTFWEYCILTTLETQQEQQFILATADGPREAPGGDRLSIMAALGREGWELVTVRPLATGLTEFYFKREV